MDEEKNVKEMLACYCILYLSFPSHSSSKIAFPAFLGTNYLTIICSFRILTKSTKPHSTFKANTKSLSENNRDISSDQCTLFLGISSLFVEIGRTSLRLSTQMWHVCFEKWDHFFHVNTRRVNAYFLRGNCFVNFTHLSTTSLQLHTAGVCPVSHTLYMTS